MLTVIPKLIRSLNLASLLGFILIIGQSSAISGLHDGHAWALASLFQQSSGPTYYVSPRGNDRNSGLSPSEAWRTIGRVNQHDFDPGSRILFEGQQAFAGNLYMDEIDCRGGSASAPTSIGSYGGGPATILAGDLYGIYVRNCDYVEIWGLVVNGSGNDNSNSGVEIVNALSGDVMLSHILVDDLDVSGFRQGIRLRAANGMSGFGQIWVTNNHVHHNVDSGISTNWEANNHARDERPFKDLYIGYNRVHNNVGDPAKSGHTGSGIIAGSVEEATIENNLAFYNGSSNSSDLWGPVGIWAWDCMRTVIQYNQVYANRSSSVVDGGGIDLDGGCQDSIIQYNLTHDNDGAGIMVGQFAGAREMTDITVRYNLSVNDARRNNYGGIHLFTAPGTTLERVNIYQNTVFISPGQKSAAAFGISNWFPGLRETQVINNSFISGGGAAFIDIPQAGNDIRFVGNNYDSTGHAFAVHFAGHDYDSLAGWRDATGQEQQNGHDVGSTVDAGVWNVGGAVPEDYQLLPNSALVDRGLDLASFFGPGLIQKDFFSNPVPARNGYDIGMHELPSNLPPPTETPMPTPTPAPTAEPGAAYNIYLPVSKGMP